MLRDGYRAKTETESACDDDEDKEQERVKHRMPFDPSLDPLKDVHVHVRFGVVAVGLEAIEGKRTSSGCCALIRTVVLISLSASQVDAKCKHMHSTEIEDTAWFFHHQRAFRALQGAVRFRLELTNVEPPTTQPGF